MFDNTVRRVARAAPVPALSLPARRASNGRCAPRSRNGSRAFEHPAFSRTRTVERLEGDQGADPRFDPHAGQASVRGVPVASSAVDGMQPAFVVWLIRWLMPALADALGTGYAGTAHGALTADRIVLTPEGRLVIVEHVLGPALDQLQFPADRLWHDFGIIVPPASDSAPRLDGRTDVIQLALVALSLLVGRRVTLEEYSQSLGRVLDEFTSRPRGAGYHPLFTLVASCGSSVRFK